MDWCKVELEHKKLTDCDLRVADFVRNDQRRLQTNVATYAPGNFGITQRFLQSKTCEQHRSNVNMLQVYMTLSVSRTSPVVYRAFSSAFVEDGQGAVQVKGLTYVSHCLLCGVQHLSPQLKHNPAF